MKMIVHTFFRHSASAPVWTSGTKNTACAPVWTSDAKNPDYYPDSI